MSAIENKKLRQIIGEIILVFQESVLIKTGAFPIETNRKRQHNAGSVGSLEFGSGEAESQQGVKLIGCTALAGPVSLP